MARDEWLMRCRRLTNRMKVRSEGERRYLCPCDHAECEYAQQCGFKEGFALRAKGLNGTESCCHSSRMQAVRTRGVYASYKTVSHAHFQTSRQAGWYDRAFSGRAALITRELAMEGGQMGDFASSLPYVCGRPRLRGTPRPSACPAGR